MARTLWDALGEIEDGRGRKGRQYQLRSLLGIALAAMLAGANDLLAIHRWGRRLRPEALALFDIQGGKVPCHATFHYFFQSLDASAKRPRVFGATVSPFFRQRRPFGGRKLVVAQLIVTSISECGTAAVAASTANETQNRQWVFPAPYVMGCDS